MMCALGVSLPSALTAQDAAAAYSIRAIHFATPLLPPSLAAAYATTIRLPLGYDLESTARFRAENYLPEFLLARDSIVRRWADRTNDPIRVWIQPGGGIASWDNTFPAMAREALDEWVTVGLPIRFALVADSAAAEMTVLWAEKLGNDESGRTVWWSTSKGWITRARVTLSTYASDGMPQTPKALRAVALHELGHALGLSHSTDARNIMAPWVEVAELSDADRNTANMLYEMPVGRVSASAAEAQANASGMQRREKAGRSANPE